MIFCKVLAVFAMIAISAFSQEVCEEKQQPLTVQCIYTEQMKERNEAAGTANLQGRPGKQGPKGHAGIQVSLVSIFNRG